MNITLSPDIELALAEEARRRGTTPERLALDCLRERFTRGPVPEPAVEGETMADFLKDYIGIISSREHAPEGPSMSENCGRQFADGMEEKRRQGRP